MFRRPESPVCYFEGHFEAARGVGRGSGNCLSASYRTDHKETICTPFSPNTLPKIHSDGHCLLLKAELTGSEPFRLKCNGALERL